jgi:hypothetical protein
VQIDHSDRRKRSRPTYQNPFALRIFLNDLAREDGSHHVVSVEAFLDGVKYRVSFDEVGSIPH